MIASNFQNFPERIPSRIKRDTNKLAICLRTQKKKKNSQSSKFRRKGFSRKSLNLESRKEGKGSALKRRARSKGAFTPVQDRATKFPDNSIHPNSWLIDGYQPLFFFSLQTRQRHFDPSTVVVSDALRGKGKRVEGVDRPG